MISPNLKVNEGRAFGGKWWDPNFGGCGKGSKYYKSRFLVNGVCHRNCLTISQSEFILTEYELQMSKEPINIINIDHFTKFN